MKNKFKFTILLVGVLAGLAAQGAGLMKASETFGDVSANHANAEAINAVQSLNIVGGYADGTFRPDSLVNRAELVKIIIGAQFSSEAIDQCAKKNTKPNWTYMFFADVPIDAWFAKYICLGKMNGIIGGYPDGTFRPEQKVNFAEAAQIMSKWLRVNTSSDAVWYKPLVDKLGEKNAIPPTIKAFDQGLTRGEMAEMVYRLKSNITTKESSDYESIKAHSGEWKTTRSAKYRFEMKAPAGWNNRAEKLPTRIEFYSEDLGIATNGCGLIQASANEPEISKWYKGYYQEQKAKVQKKGLPFSMPSPELFEPTTFNGVASIQANGIAEGEKQLTIIYLTRNNDVYSCSYPDNDFNDSRFGSHKGLYQKVASTFRFTEEKNVEWKTLNNVRYGYALSYPSDWILKSTYSEKGFTPRGIGDGRTYIGGETSWKGPGASQLNLSVYQVKPEMTYEKFISIRDLKSGEKKDIKLNGVGAVKLTWANPDGDTASRAMALIKQGEKMFVFDLTGGNSIPQSEKSIADKIIGSFTFQASNPNTPLENTADWKIYHNEAQGYSVSYPQTLEPKEANDSYFSQKVGFAPADSTNDLAQVGVLSATTQNYLDSFDKNTNLKIIRELSDVPIGEFKGTKITYQNLLTNDVFSVYVLALEKRSFSMTADPSIADAFVSSFKITAPKECTDPPVSTDIGRDIYPIAEKYSKLKLLGELFTAADCNLERLGKIFGVSGEDYTLGSGLRLNKNPSTELATELKGIGYTCKEINDDTLCRYWSLDKSAKVSDLQKLIPYLDFIESNDCVNCG